MENKIKVYRFDYRNNDKSRIVETYVDAIGYPNVDSDGCTWQEGEHFTDLEKAKKYAVKFLVSEIDNCRERLSTLQKELNMLTDSLHSILLTEQDKNMLLIDYVKKLKE
jgi:hypothetical protein